MELRVEELPWGEGRRLHSWLYTDLPIICTYYKELGESGTNRTHQEKTSFKPPAFAVKRNQFISISTIGCHCLQQQFSVVVKLLGSVPTLPLAGCVTFGKSLHLSGPRLADITYFVGVS